MDDESYDGYDGGMYSGGGTKGSRGKTKIPRFKSIIRKGHRGRRSRNNNINDPETTIVMWVVITLLVSAVSHAEWLFVSLYMLFVFYTLLTKDVWPIRFVSKILTTMGILFFVAITLVLLINLMVDESIDSTILIAYGYIIKIPLLSWSIVWLLESWIDWINTKQIAKENFIEKEKSGKLLLLKIAKGSFIASALIIIFVVGNFIYPFYYWNFGLFNQILGMIAYWKVDLIIGITLLGKFSKWLVYKD
ncbi:hypothetical protein HUN92_21900 [Bacillus firmus]|uniref:hypothetical protein n=1 Tax=Cytobacillus firmus TaxID=1399 RepID=UPI001580FE20|nr:hypothetical protein [Cytobacillus firmus]NUH86298.1 hypothetical protein [Cytobacillus firmus]